MDVSGRRDLRGVAAAHIHNSLGALGMSEDDPYGLFVAVPREVMQGGDSPGFEPLLRRKLPVHGPFNYWLSIQILVTTRPHA